MIPSYIGKYAQLIYNPIGYLDRRKVESLVEKVSFNEITREAFGAITQTYVRKRVLEEMTLNTTVRRKKRDWSSEALSIINSYKQEYESSWIPFFRNFAGLSATFAFWMLIGGFILSNVPGKERIQEQTLKESYDIPNKQLQKPTKSLEEVTIDTITFELAKADVKSGNDLYAQLFLDRILQNRGGYGVRGWEAYSKFVYSPSSINIRKNLKEKGMVTPQIDISIPLYYTVFPFSLQFGNLSTLYFDDNVFTKLDNLDDLLSVIDYNAAKAMLSLEGKSHIGLSFSDFGQGITRATLALILEVLSAEKQLSHILNGTRNVSPEFEETSLERAQKLFKKLEKVANYETKDGENAFKIINAIRRRPTYALLKNLPRI